MSENEADAAWMHPSFWQKMYYFVPKSCSKHVTMLLKAVKMPRAEKGNITQLCHQNFVFLI